MERLTSYKSVCKREMICRHEDCDTCEEYCPHINEDNCLCLQEVLEKLAAYEDIGLKPEQIQEIDKLYAEKCKELAELEKKSFSGIEMVKIWANLQKLKEYKELEDKGKLLKLPCANWMEIVFGEQEVFWGIDTDYIENPIREITVDSSERMTWYDGWKTVVLKGADDNGLDWEFSPEEIGKTVFLTKEEAEAALKEL